MFILLFVKVCFILASLSLYFVIVACLVSVGTAVGIAEVVVVAAAAAVVAGDDLQVTW